MITPLEVTSSNSLLQSTLRIDEYVKKAAQLGYKSLVLSDLNVMYGTLDFYHACKKYNIKPIYGLTLEFESDAKVILLAKDINGYHSLLKLSSLKMTVLKQQVELDEFVNTLGQYLNGIYVIFPATKSLLSKYSAYADRILETLKNTNNAGMYLGIDPTLSKGEALNIEVLAKQTKTDLIAASAIYYLDQADLFEVNVLRAIKDGEKIQSDTVKKDLGKNYLKEPGQYLKDYEASGLSEAIKNNEALIERIDVELTFSKTRLPHFKTPNDLSAKDYLQKLCQEGLRQRIQANQIVDTKPYFDRLKYELSVINEMGFDDYFLIVWDITNYAHEHQIRIGPGRGSAAGSLVSYVLKITDVDPIKYDLLFERFLNRKRAQMPDIDLDIPDIKRDQIIRYVHQKYGHTHMAQIITFGTLGARQAIRDVGRVMGLTPFEIDKWAKALPHKYKLTLKEAYETSQQVKNLIADSQKNELLFKTALKLEGLPRHYSTHAAGVILSDETLSDLIPVQLGSDEILLSQFAKEQVEEAGLLKIDLLGLRNLTTLDETLRFIQKGYGKKVDLKKLPLDDPLTLRLFQAGQTNGIFQFESDGIKNVLRRLHPTSFEDIAAVNALFRPGPLENIPEFIARKHGEETVIYPEEKLRAVLEKTHGIIVYQEQVMQVASVMGGFSLGEADLLRRAISKKDQATIERLQVNFIDGAVKQGVSKKVANEVYTYIKRFGGYGFNRSHAIAYSKMAFELAYLKSHYPLAFFAALLNSIAGNDVKVREYLNEAKVFGAKIVGPDINKSQTNFSIQDQKLVFGFSAIKTVRRDLIKAIVQERYQHGPYKDLTDLVKRIDKKLLKKEQLEALIYAGAFDSLERDRAKLLATLSSVLSNIELSGESETLFKLLEPKDVAPEEEISEYELLEKEAYYLGMYVSRHPLEKYNWLKNAKQITSLADLKISQVNQVLVYVKNIREIRTKTGEKMVFLQVSDQSLDGEIVIFPREYRHFKELCQVGSILLVTGKGEVRQNKKSVLASEVILASEFDKHYYLRLTKDFEKDKRQELWQLLKAYHGNSPVILIEENENKKIILQENLWLKNDNATKEALTNLLGSENLVFK